MGMSINRRGDADLLFDVTVHEGTLARSTVRLTVGDGCAGFERDESGGPRSDTERVRSIRTPGRDV